jgi:hypothetical protein
MYLRRGPGDESFDCQLPAEARIELLEEIPPPPMYRLREIPAYRPVQEPPPEVFLRPPPPVSPPLPPVTPGAPGRRRGHPAAAPEYGYRWGVQFLLALLGQAVSTQVDGTQPQSRSVEVRRAAPAAGRRPQSVAGGSARSSDSGQPVRLLDGTTVRAFYQGELPSSAALPSQGRFIGEEWSTGNTSWIWIKPAGAHFASWVDP